MKLFGISAPMTGSGKTTVTLAFLRKLNNSISFKIGPDYIDGQLHSSITGKPAASIDRWLQGRNYRHIIPRFAGGNDYGVVEGVMGLYDAGSRTNMSTADYFEKLKIPYILVVDISKMAESAYYVAKGFLGNRTIGVILNNYHSEKHLLMVKDEFVKHGIRIIGAIPHDESLTLPERHLGLTLDVDSSAVNQISDRIGKHLDLSFLDDMEEITPDSYIEPMQPQGNLEIYVASDAAFNFYYETSIRALERMGNVNYFSPLANEVPEDPDFLYFGGGYPELYAEELSKAEESRKSILELSGNGVPIIAECGGLMYMERKIQTDKGELVMVGAFKGTVNENRKLTLSYTKLKATESSLLFRAGDILYGHEFHYSTVNDDSPKKLVNIVGTGISGEDGIQISNTFGSYSHFDLERYKKRLYSNISKHKYG